MSTRTTAQETLGDRYVLAARIGEDATGATHLARDTRLGRDVCVRVLRATPSPRLRRSFEREARILGALQHAAMPTVFEVRLDDDPPYVVLERLEGEPLAELLELRQPQPLPVVLRVAIRLLGAVQAAHENGFVLREIHPEAVLLVETEDGLTPKILALGAARRRGSQSSTTGTGDQRRLLPVHTAPEVLVSDAVDPRSDIYAVGALAYDLLLGRPPIEVEAGTDLVRAMGKLARGEVTAPSEIDASVPPRLEATLLRALARDVEARFQSADAMAAALARLASGGPRPSASELALTRRRVAVPAIGQRVGDYVVRAELGSGAMGTVLLARDEILQRDVALKVLRSVDARERERLRAEARTMAKVDHPNVVRIFALGDHEGAPYLVMEHVPGSTVERRLAESPGGLAVDEAIAIVDQTARGLGAVHDAGLIHGDVKPSNVLIGPAFRIGVTDFGLARASGSFGGEEMRVAGTPAYCPPERVRGRLDPALADRADLYSLAVMTYELLTGRLPFVEDEPIRMLRLHVEATPLPPSSVRGDLPTALDEPILRALAKSPNDRQASVHEYREELLNAAEALRRRSPRRLLIVDDDEDFRKLLSAYLNALYPEATLALRATVGGALEALGSERYDAVLLDLDLPDGNAVELAARVRAELADPPPLLVVTGTGTAADWQVLAALGVRAFLLKPLDRD
ncbi:MAG: serine/threonine-protein kinase, partial [Myxococcota bacterium]